jgi:1-phosphofructokinase
MQTAVVTVTLNPALDKTVTIPSFEIGGLNRVQDVRVDAGGKGINVAKVLNQFGVNVTATGFVAGMQGDYLLGQLEQAGIRAAFTNVEGETRTNLKIYDEAAKITTEVNESGFRISAEVLDRFRQQFDALLDQAGLLVLGGSIPPGVPEEIYAELIRAAHAKGVRTILDAEGEAFKKGLAARPYAVKPNVYELELLVGRKLETDQEIVAAGQEWIAQGISLITISMGGDGAIVLTPDEAYRVRPFPITPQSTVGAGDSMVAAICYCLLNGMNVQETLEWAATAGTVTASKRGTQVCTLAEVREHVGHVQATRI